MAAYFGTAALLAGCALIAAIVLDVAVRGILRRCTGLLPDDLCGPDGWLLDTTRQCGVFDRRCRK